MTTITQFTPISEACTATIHQQMETGESYTGPLHVGYYPDKEVQDPQYTELWIEQEGRRVQFFSKNLPGLIKQLKRAQALAKEHAR